MNLKKIISCLALMGIVVPVTNTSAQKKKTTFRFFAEGAWQQQINGVDIQGAKRGVISLPAKSNLGLSLNATGEKNGFYLRFGLGILQQPSAFTVTDPEQHTVLYRSDFTNYYTTIKLGAGIIAKRWQNGSRLGLELNYTALSSNNNKTDVVLVKQGYMLSGQPAEDVRAYIDYDYGGTEPVDIGGILSLFSVTPVYQSRPLFGRSAIRVGLDISTKVGANRYGSTNAAQVAIFKGGGDRTIIAEEKYFDQHLTIGLLLGLTF